MMLTAWCSKTRIYWSDGDRENTKKRFRTWRKPYPTFMPHLRWRIIGGTFQSRPAQNMVHTPTASELLGDCQKCHLGSCSILPNLNLWGWVPGICVLTSPQGIGLMHRFETEMRPARHEIDINAFAGQMHVGLCEIIAISGWPTIRGS